MQSRAAALIRVES